MSDYTISTAEQDTELPALPFLPDPVNTDPDSQPKASTAPKRPTTRAGRKAAAEAKAAAGKPPKKSTAPKAAKPLPRKASLETRLADNLIGTGAMLAMLGGMLGPAFTADGVLVVEQAPTVAAALAKVANDQPRVKRALEAYLTGATTLGLANALLPLAIGIAANHGKVPAFVMEALVATAANLEPDA